MVENKIILILQKSEDSYGKNYSCYACESSCIDHRILPKFLKASTIRSIKKAIEKNENGKFIYDDCVIYIAPASISNINNFNWPLVIIKNDEIIDVDEWYYSPFKPLLCSRSYKGHYYDNINLESCNRSSETINDLDNQYFMKFVNSKDEHDVLYAIKTENITFYIND